MPPPPPFPPPRRGRHPFTSPILRTFTLAGEHGTARRYWLEAGLLAGGLLPLLAPLVGLAVVTPLVRLAASVGGEIGPATACYGPGVQVSDEGRWMGGRAGRGAWREGGGGAPSAATRTRALNLIVFLFSFL